MDNVHKLELVQVGEDFRFSADEVLEDAKGQDFRTVVVIGQLADGGIFISGNANAGETLILMKRVEASIVFDDD